jgi:uncharacterized protein YndB with AHSA1/START domain
MIVKSVTLQLAPTAAFELFTQRINDWWPADRRHTQDPSSKIFMLASGRFYERTPDGHEVDLGHVRRWEPPGRILLDFFIATGREQPTKVEITFTAQKDGTQVTVIHRPTATSENLWAERAPRYGRSWDAVLAALILAAD